MTRSEWTDIFGDNLSSILEDQGMSQNQLAKDSGVSIGMISDYVNKFSAPGIFAAINMSYALDIDIDELLDFGEPIEP